MGVLLLAAWAPVARAEAPALREAPPTWVVDPGSGPRLPAPPSPDSPTTRGELDELLAIQEARTTGQLTSVRRWDDGSAIGPWVKVGLDAIAAHALNPVRAARALALVSVAMHDATVIATRAGHHFGRPPPCSLEPRLAPVDRDCSGFSYPAEHAVVAGAAATVLAHLFPDRAAQFLDLADQAAASRLRAGTNYRSDLAAGLALGRWTGREVVARARADGSDARSEAQAPIEPGRWAPTPPELRVVPLEPLAGTWRTWNLASGSQFRPGPPPAPGSDRFDAELREVYDVSRALTPEQRRIARYWADGPGSLTPPGHWNAIALRLARARGVSTPQAALVFAALNTAQADALVAAWDAKYAYWAVRPVTAIRAELDPEWSPYVETPPFPSYVSGHATTSAAAAEVLAHAFPGDASQLRDWAEEAAASRLYGGIHCRSDNQAGLELGRQVAGAALAKIGP